MKHGSLQNGCDLNPSNNTSDHGINIYPPEPPSGDHNSQSTHLNNSPQRSNTTTNHNTPNIVDNLGYLAAHDM